MCRNTSAGNWSTIGWFGCNSTPPDATDKVDLSFL